VITCQEKLQWKAIAVEFTAMKGQPSIIAYIFCNFKYFQASKLHITLQHIPIAGEVFKGGDTTCIRLEFLFGEDQNITQITTLNALKTS
jgi:hypothetical protein